jgi:hypothetical protein
MHKLELSLIVTVAVIGGLILLGVVVASIRAMLRGHFILESSFSAIDEKTAEAQAASEALWHRSLVAFDQMMNVIVFYGYPDETISSHAWRASRKGRLWGRILIKWLELLEPDHGQKAAAGDRYRAALVQAIEKQALGI